MDSSDATPSSQFLTFTLDEERYAVEIAKVREVLEFTAVNRVPRTPEFMRGMINLRGNIVPVIDLRLKLGLSRTERTVDTCVIITEVEMDGESVVLGALADSVQEVIDLLPADISPAPKIGTRLRTEFIRGMGKRDDKFIIILDIDKVFSSDELTAAQEMTVDAQTMERAAV